MLLLAIETIDAGTDTVGRGDASRAGSAAVREAAGSAGASAGGSSAADAGPAGAGVAVAAREDGVARRRVKSCEICCDRRGPCDAPLGAGEAVDGRDPPALSAPPSPAAPSRLRVDLMLVAMESSDARRGAGRMARIRPAMLRRSLDLAVSDPSAAAASGCTVTSSASWAAAAPAAPACVPAPPSVAPSVAARAAAACALGEHKGQLHGFRLAGVACPSVDMPRRRWRTFSKRACQSFMRRRWRAVTKAGLSSWSPYMRISDACGTPDAAESGVLKPNVDSTPRPDRRRGRATPAAPSPSPSLCKRSGNAAANA